MAASDTALNYNGRQILFRGDTRSPDEIFRSGFVARRPDRNTGLENYVIHNNPSPYVSTSTSEWAAMMFLRGRRGWLYKIRTRVTRVDTVSQLGPNEYGHQMEVAVLRNVPAEDIECAWACDAVQLIESSSDRRDGEQVRWYRRPRDGEDAVEGLKRGEIKRNRLFRPG